MYVNLEGFAVIIIDDITTTMKTIVTIVKHNNDSDNIQNNTTVIPRCLGFLSSFLTPYGFAKKNPPAKSLLETPRCWI